MDKILHQLIQASLILPSQILHFLRGKPSKIAIGWPPLESKIPNLETIIFRFHSLKFLEEINAYTWKVS